MVDSYSACIRSQSPILHGELGNPRWSPRDHENVFLLISLQPGMIETQMKCAFVCFQV